MAELNSTKTRMSRYVAGGTTEVNSFGLEWWERIEMPTSDTDKQMVVSHQTQHRLDLIAAEVYNESRYWWVIAQYNNILDPFDEVVIGRVLYIPDLDRIKSLSLNQLGGIASKREVPTSVLPIV